MSDKTLNIEILLFNEFSNLCLANTLEPLRAANTFVSRKLYSWRFVTMDGLPATSSSGIPVMPHDKFDSSVRADMLFVISSYGYRELAIVETHNAIRLGARNADVVIGLDTGAWLMAGAGLLKNKTATVHWDILTNFEETFLDIDAVRQPYVVDGKMITCGGAMASFDLMLFLISKQFGSGLGFDISELFLKSASLDIAPEIMGANTQKAPSLTSQTIALMKEHQEKPLSIPMLANQMGCSQKKLERAFKQEYGVPTRHIYRRIRLSTIRQLVENTDIPIAEITVRGGYENASAMTRAFVAEFGYTPSSIRKG